MKTVSIFVSSPGDVRQERQVAANVISRLQTELANHVAVKAYFWEHEPIHAGADFQSQIPPPAQSDVLVGILWSRLGTRLHSSHARPDGRPYLSGTEYEFENALEHYRNSATKTPRLLIYRRDETPLIPAEPREVFEERKRQWDSLQRFIEHWFIDLTDGSTFKAAFRGYRHTAEFEEILEKHLRKTIVEIAGSDLTSTCDQMAIPVWTKVSPYRGFKVFEFEHAPIFFGRTHAIGDVIGQLRDQLGQGRPPFVVVFGASGSGKSSLLRAGVIPALVNAGVERFGSWRRAIFRPSMSSGDLFEGLAVALCDEAAIPEIAQAGITTVELATRLRDNPSGLEMYLAGTLHQLAREAHAAEKQRLRQEAALLRQSGRENDAEYIERFLEALQFSELRLILGLDQLEELFVLGDRFPTPDRKRFLSVIASLVQVKAPCVWIVATLRSDFYSRCEESEDLVRLMDGKGQYRLLQPSGVELGQLIRYPAQAAGVRFENHALKGGLDEVLRDAALGEERSLPLLELTLDRLFETVNQTREMRHEAYEQLGGEKGGLRGVLLKVANDCYNELSVDGKTSFASVFKNLASLDFNRGTNKGGPAHFSRRIVGRNSLKRLTAGAAEVIEKFTAARLLVADLDDALNEVVSVAHEALLNEWDFLRGLLEREMDFLRLRARFATAAAEWERDSRNPRRLARGLALAEAREVARIEPEGLQPYEADYISLSRRRHSLKLAGLLGLAAGLVLTFGGLAISASLSARKAREALSRSDVSRAAELFQQGDSASGVAFLAGAVAEDPHSELAGDRLWFALTQRSWPFAASPGERGHPSISAICFSPDGTRIVTGSPNGTVQVWDAEHAKFINVSPAPHKNIVLCCAFSPDGTRFITGSRDATAWLWDARTGQPLRRLASHEDSIGCVAFSQDSRLVATGSRDRTVRIWDAVEGSAVQKPLQHPTEVNSIGFGPSHSTHVVTSFENVARVWDFQTGEILFDLPHQKTVTSAQFSATGDVILTTSKDGCARLWSATGQLIRTSSPSAVGMENASISPTMDHVAAICGSEVLLWHAELVQPVSLAHDYPVTCISFSIDGSKLLTATDDGKVRVWSAFTGQRLGEPIDERDQILGASFTPNGHILLGTSTGLLRSWTSPTVLPIGNTMHHDKAVQALALSPDEKIVLSGAADHQTRLWNLSTSRLIGNPMPNEAPVVGTAFAPDGKYFLTAAANRATVWETATREKTGKTFQTDGDIDCVAFNPEGQTFATATLNGEARFWEIPGCQPHGMVMHHAARITAIIFDAHKDHFITASLDGKIKFWDAHNGSLISTTSPGFGITCAALSSDGTFLAAGSSTGEVCLWDRKSGLRIDSGTMRHDKRVNACLFSPDGTALASCSDDGTASLWDVKTGRPRFGLLRNASGSDAEPITNLAFSMDGRRLGTGSDDGSILIWDAANGRQLSERLTHRDSVTALRFLRDGNLLVSAANDGWISLWDLNSPMHREDRVEVAKLANMLMPVHLATADRLERTEMITLPELVAKFPRGDQSYAARLAHFLTEPLPVRRLSPFSEQSLADHIDALLSEGSNSSLNEAAILASGDRTLEKKVDVERQSRGR
jgi:WD40 repeat protein